MQEKLESIYTQFESELNGVEERAALQNLKSVYLGKKGHISEILKSLRDLPADERKNVGSLANEFKQKIELRFSDKLEEIETSTITKNLEQKWVDPTLRDSSKELGLQAAGIHPLTAIQRELEDVFLSMGFDVLDGPHIEDDYHNFEALNIPPNHPARDMQDTFWFSDSTHLLRTHTSPVQIRGMENRRPPFRFIVPGKVFRCERTDASHEMAFHQLEGMMVDKGVSIGHLTFFAKKLFTAVFQHEVEIRTRPSYFPFVEPGLEIDLQCSVCKGKGCSVCSRSGWVEMLGAGLVHPHVLAAGNIDARVYSGFAFGIGLDRLLMMRYAIDDIRHILSGDLRFVSQFRSY